ncbi:hypothetical protein TWF281_011524 [Arthrobotrys megalospora]
MVPLANEILQQIFCDGRLSAADHFNILRVCKRFKDVIEKNRKCSLAVDALSHPMWKFGRRLLSDPEFGEQINEITLTWERRRFKGPRPQQPDARKKAATTVLEITTDWVWTEAEKQQILDICEEWEITKKTTYLILGGVNSEALLPLILCLTPRLKSLDLGCPEVEIICFDRHWSHHAYRRATQILNRSCRLVREDSSGDDEYINRAAPYLDYYRLRKKFEPKTHCLFFFENLQYKTRAGEIIGPRKLFPGLTSLQHFSMGSEVWNPVRLLSNLRPPYPTQPWVIYPILLFPRIKTIRFCINGGEGGYASGRYARFEPHSDGPSAVKRLEMHASLFGTEADVDRQAYLKTISTLTGNLERVYIRTWRKDRWRLETSNPAFSHGRVEPGLLEDDKVILNSFLHHNPNSLKSSGILINGGGFDRMGVFSIDEERVRGTAERQRAFEIIRRGGRCLYEKAAPPRITFLNGDIIFRILGYLQRYDKFNLMLSCKALYDYCHRDIWSRFRIFGYGRIYEREHPDYIAYGRLVRLQNCVNTEGVSGFGHLKQLRFVGNTLSERSIHVETLRFLTDRIRAGDMPNLRLLDVGIHSNWGYDFSNRDRPETRRFLTALKEYSEKKSPEDFSLHLRMFLGGKNLSRLFDYTNLKSLEVDLTNVLEHDVSDAIVRASNLIKILTAAPNLESLSITGGSLQPESQANIRRLWEMLESLQTTVSNLKKLRSLTQEVNAIFHPSFLLAPPIGCKTVSYRLLRPSPAWWRKFAREPFTGVERMTLKCFELDVESVKELFEQEGEDITPSDCLELGDIEVTGLTEFHIKRGFGRRRGPKLRKYIFTPVSYAYPKDFPELILKKNKKLRGDCIQQLADGIARELKDTVDLSSAQEKAVELEAWLKDQGVYLQVGKDLDCASEEEEVVKVKEEVEESDSSSSYSGRDYSTDSEFSE